MRGKTARGASKKVDYKALSDGLVKAVSFFSTPAYASKPKKAASASSSKKAAGAASAKKSGDAGKKKSSSRSGPKYIDFIIDAIRHTQKPVKGASLFAITSYLVKHHPTKNNTTAIRLALRHGVASGTLKKNKASYLVAAGVATKKKSRSKKAAAAATTTSASGGADGAAAAAAAASTSTKKASGSSKRKAASAAPPKAAAPAKRVAAAIKKAASTSRSRGAAAAAGGSKATVFDTSTKAPKAEGIMWQYHHGVWKDYKSEASDVVERAYQEWKSNPYTDVRSIKSGDWEYQVDFTNMRQTNIQHDAHTQRDIRRHVIGTE